MMSMEESRENDCWCSRIDERRSIEYEILYKDIDNYNQNNHKKIGDVVDEESTVAGVKNIFFDNRINWGYCCLP